MKGGKNQAKFVGPRAEVQGSGVADWSPWGLRPQPPYPKSLTKSMGPV